MSDFDFRQLATTVGWGSAVCVGSLICFGIAINFGANPEVAPRTWARPKQVIKNILRRPYCVRWIPWSLGLSYKQMLEGIDGTGTRKNGWSGSFLRSNLDGVVVCKFNALCLRVSCFATFLCIFIILPLNYTANCNPLVSGAEVCKNMTQLTDFETTTLAHIPPYGATEFTEEEIDDSEVFEPETILDLIKESLRIVTDITPRLYAVVLVAWAIYIYCCYLITIEWNDNLALRRAFYLEKNHYEDRKEELDYLSSLQDPEDPLQNQRPPFLPHPELRDNVPSVCLYSVLYKLPYHLSNRTETILSSRIEVISKACTEFFDKIVPNQPGFSSSVVALTILPDSAQVTKAWKKWTKCAAKLRRLRFIRKRIHELHDKEEGFADKGLEEFEPFLSQALKMDDSSVAFALDSINQKRRSSRTSQSFPSSMQTEKFILSSGQTETGDSFHSAEEDFPESPKDSKLQCIKESYEDRSDENDTRNSTELGIENEAAHTKPAAFENGGEENAFLKVVGDFFHSFSNNHQDPRNGSVGDENDPERLEIGAGSISSELTREKETTTSVSIFDEPDENVDHSDRRRGANGIQTVGLEQSSVYESARGQGDSTPSVNPGAPSLFNSGIPNHPMNRQQRHLFANANSEGRKSSQISNSREWGTERGEFLNDDGIEQLSVYCREFAQSSAGCCPYGCDEIAIRVATIEKLEELEEIAEGEAKEANKELIEARQTANSMLSDGSVDQRVLDCRSRQLSLLNLEVESSSDESSDDESSVGNVDRRSAMRQMRQRKTSSRNQWKQANRNLRDSPRTKGGFQQRKIASGRWRFPSIGSTIKKIKEDHLTKMRLAATGTNKIVKSAVERCNYAVVTFTSRQAAIAARQCLADGSGWDRWEEVEDIPVPPLADGPAWNLLFGRGLCKPVTLTLNDNQKKLRHKCTIVGLIVFFVAYTVPLSYASTLLSSQVEHILPGLSDISTNLNGIITGMLYTLFFSVCPFIFKAFANFGSGATSIRQAEHKALKWYWLFILITAFFGNFLFTIARRGLNAGLNIGAEAQDILRLVANTLPTSISATWLNWILVRAFFTIPLTYLLQVNTFLFRFPGFGCCSRLVRGGGPGGPMPYRIYVDTGNVFLCIVALAPVCPLVAPAALLYFLLFTPAIRWLLLFVYRPEYDGGGLRWPIVHDILISSLILSQILLTTSMALKLAYGPAILAGFSMVPTIIFNELMKEGFLRSYTDAGLLQTSELDGWDTNTPTSPTIREEYRRWLVDAHKASFVPICLAGLDNFLTIEPAAIVATERDGIQGNSINEIQVSPAAAEAAELLNSVLPPEVDTSLLAANDKEESDVEMMNSQPPLHSGPFQRGAFFRRSPATARHFFTQSV